MKLVILDRDGVINQDSEDYIKAPAEWVPIAGSLEAISLLNQKGYTVAIATNQSGIARGYYSEQILSTIHTKMHDLLKLHGGKIDSIFYCPHGPGDGCTCRKPLPGLLNQIALHYRTDLTNTPFVGDSWRDIETAVSAGATPVLVLTGNGSKTLAKYHEAFKKFAYYENLWDFAQQQC